jgi:hypothetical protein
MGDNIETGTEMEFIQLFQDNVQPRALLNMGMNLKIP